MQTSPGISVDILIIRNNRVLLGLMTKKWAYEGRQVYGVPGRDIRFREKIGETVARNIREEFDCGVTGHEIFCINANYALDGHYIGIGVLAQIDGDPKVLLPDDWERWEWVALNSIPENLFPATKNLIDCYLSKKISIAE